MRLTINRMGLRNIVDGDPFLQDESQVSESALATFICGIVRVLELLIAEHHANFTVKLEQFLKVGLHNSKPAILDLQRSTYQEQCKQADLVAKFFDRVNEGISN